MKYIIISLKHSTKKQICFWREGNCGYTYFPFAAGHYDESTVKANPDYYNNGESDIAIPLTEIGMDSIGFKCSVDNKKVLALADKITG